MKHRLIGLVMLLLCIALPSAAEQMPGIEVFSPGLMRVGERLARGERVETDAEIDVTDMLYARDLSVLSAMLEGTTFSLCSSGSMENGQDALKIARGGEELFAFHQAHAGDAAEITVGGSTFAVDRAALGLTAGVRTGADWLAGAAVLERVPLEAVYETIIALEEGDALLAGFAVTKAFAAEKTYSDDGTRLTKIVISGEMARAGEAPWRVEGFLRQPGGKSPKDTFEITLTQDEHNHVALSYSALRKSQITRKNREGETSVDSTLKLEGLLAGSRVTSRLRVITTNAWTAEGDALTEKVTVSATLGHTDNTPGRRMLRLNDMSAKLRAVLSLTTTPAQETAVSVGERVTLSAVFDGNTFLDLAVEGKTRVGGEAQPVQLTGAQTGGTDALGEAFQDAAVQMMQRIYAQLDEKTRKKIGAGL